MIPKDILDKILKIHPTLQEKYGVSELGFFGSVVRTDFKIDSDIDLLVSFSRPIGFEIVDMVMFIESQLGRQVDLLTKNSLKSPLKEIIESEVEYV